jgi:hypothetical protein
MKIIHVFGILILPTLLLLAHSSRADDITATNSGNWSDTNVWQGGVVPGTNDDADIPAGMDVTINTNVSVQFIYDDGVVTMSPYSTLNIVGDPAGAQGTYQLGTLDASAVGNTVIYSGNPFWAKHQDYYNLIFSNTASSATLDFYNGKVNSQDPAAAMTIAGNMTVIGKIKVQQGDDFTIGGNLTLGTNSTWDCSSFNLTVTSNLLMGGLLLDLDGASGSNYFEGNVMVASNSVGWNVSDVTQWAIGGSLTNNGLIVGTGYGNISFDGAGVITGSKPIKLPTMTINGTYMIGTTITLTTNTPTLNGTLVFDLANTNQIILQSYPTNPLTLYYSGALDVINSGSAPMSGSVYTFFVATNYGGTFDTTTFPNLASGLSWVANLTSSGSIAVTGATNGSSPDITVSHFDPSSRQFTLTWSSEVGATYTVEETLSLSAPITWTPLQTDIPSGGSTTTFTVTMPTGTNGFLRVLQQ